MKQPAHLLKYEHFDSLAEMGEAARERYIPSRYSASDSWSGATADEAWRYCEEGWDAPLERVETTFTDTRTAHQFAPVLDVAGDVVDMGLFLQGEPECMLSYPLQERKVASIDLLVPICYSAMVNPSTAEYRAIATMAAIESYRERGVSVSVTCYMVIHGSSGRKKLKDAQNKQVPPTAVVTCTLADSRFAYDPGRVAYGVGHPSVLRRVFFGLEDGWDEECHTVFNIRGGRGRSPYNLTRSHEEVREFVFNQLDGQVSIDLPELDGSMNSWSLDDHYEQIVTIMGGKYEAAIDEGEGV